MSPAITLAISILLWVSHFSGYLVEKKSTTRANSGKTFAMTGPIY